MTAVISLPHGFTVHYQLDDARLIDHIQGMPFVVPHNDQADLNIIVVDSLDHLTSLHYEHAIYLDSSCTPIDLPKNTIVLHVDPCEAFNQDLAALIKAISQGNASSLKNLQTDLSQRLDRAISGLEESIIWVDDDFKVLALTDSATVMFHGRPKQFIGYKFADMVPGSEDDLYELLTKRAAVDATDKVEIEAQLDGGEKLHLMIGIRRVGRDRYQINIVDVSSQRAADKRFIQLANYDPMTGLANRGLLFEFLRHAMARSKRSNRMVALMLLDLDHFNRVSDETGAQMGDTLLENAASRIKSLLPGQDLLARWGGDELAIVMEDIQHAETVSRIAQRIISVLSPPFVIDEQDFYVSPSIGIAVYPEADETINGLIQAADTAMFEAKKVDGLNTFRFYQTHLQEEAEERALIEQQLRRALDRQEFLVYYQPKVSMTQEKIIGFEALLRWQHPTWNNVSPEKYVPVAEECGLIGQIGDWVLRQACMQMGRWQRENPQMADCSIAVNVSPKQLNDPFLVGRIATILAESRLDADKLEIELTESAVMENPEQGIKVLNKIHELGVKISIDDFGTGYSSLSYLKKLPIDCIKIDRSFVMDIGINESTESIIQAILVMSSKLGLFNVAEGIETTEQMAFFEGTSCDLLQGYMFSKPQSEQEITALFSGPKQALHEELSQMSGRPNRPIVL